MKKNKSNIKLILIISIFLSIFTLSMVPKNPVENINTNLVEIKENEITKIFWFGCPHCYELNKNLKKLKKDNIKVNYIPASYENSRWEIEAKIFYTLEKITEKKPYLKDKIINKLFEIYKIGIPSPQKALEEISKLTNKKFSEINDIYRSEEIRNKISNLNKEMSKLKINSVPQVIIEGKKIIRPQSFSNMDEYLNKIKEEIIKD